MEGQSVGELLVSDIDANATYFLFAGFVASALIAALGAVLAARAAAMLAETRELYWRMHEKAPSGRPSKGGAPRWTARGKAAPKRKKGARAPRNGRRAVA